MLYRTNDRFCFLAEAIIQVSLSFLSPTGRSDRVIIVVTGSPQGGRSALQDTTSERARDNDQDRLRDKQMRSQRPHCRLSGARLFPGLLKSGTAF